MVAGCRLPHSEPGEERKDKTSGMERYSHRQTRLTQDNANDSSKMFDFDQIWNYPNVFDGF